MDHREQLPIGAELVGDYRIDGVLGQGGFGITYKAWHLGLDAFVAVKEYFPSEFAKRDDTLSLGPRTPKSADMFDWGRKRFLDEAKTLAKFRHPSIVRVHHVFEALNTAYMVLEYENGQSLRHWLEDLGRPATQAELDGIVPPLLDFGAARQAIAAETKTLTGIVKSGYSPPEQYLTDASLQGPWTDIYALGATLYRVVTGAAPPEAPARQMHETYEPAAVASLGEYRPAFLEALDWALKLKIDERPQSLPAFQDALRGGQKVSERGATRQAVGGKQSASERAPVSPTLRATQRTRGSALKWVVAALILIVGGTGSYFVYQHLDAERQRVQALADARAERIARMAREAEEAKRKAEALQRADDEAWKNATTQPITIPKLKDYLVNFSNGRHVSEAAQRLTTLKAFLSRCDDLASRPGEAKQGPGVAFNNIQAQKAIGACRKAVAADPQDARLQFLLGRALSAGKEFSEAKVWYEKAAAKGHASAMHNLGVLYHTGRDVPRDYAMARSWYEKAVAKGYAGAMINLGALYQNGRGVPRDFAQARSWYEKAAAKGYADAMYNLGWLYHNGKGVPRDFAQGRAWFKKAAAKGDAVAMFSLGVLYDNALGVSQDYVQARSWYEKAAAKGYARAKEALKTLDRKRK